MKFYQVPAGWHVCAKCESTAPPRSRHCNTCDVCVLKKEHHCVFTGCCVGLGNHRYFYIFLFLMWGSTLYCSCLNVCFIWPYVGELKCKVFWGDNDQHSVWDAESDFWKRRKSWEWMNLFIEYEGEKKKDNTNLKRKLESLDN